MSTDTNFKIDADQSSETLAKGAGRNDLNVNLLNDTKGSIKVNYRVNHGEVKGKGNEDYEVKAEQEWELEVEAKGAGSNVVLNVTMPNGSGWAIMAATPSNKDDYIKVAHNDTGYSSMDEAEKAADSKDKHYGDDGYYDENHNGYNAVIRIHGSKPAICKIVFKEIS